MAALLLRRTLPLALGLRPTAAAAAAAAAAAHVFSFRGYAARVAEAPPPKEVMLIDHAGTKLGVMTWADATAAAAAVPGGYVVKVVAAKARAAHGGCARARPLTGARVYLAGDAAHRPHGAAGLRRGRGQEARGRRGAEGSAACGSKRDKEVC